MTIIDFFSNNQKNSFIPKTPSAAVKAFEAGILPIEHFIYKSTSTICIDEEVTDLNEIERVIAMPNLDIYTNRLLMMILERLINDPDPEIALFAAEGINLIESRYNQKIEKLKEEIIETNDPAKIVMMAHIYYELAILNYKKEGIRLFYFKEAFANIKDVIALDKISLDDINILVKILIELEQYENAILILHQLNKNDNILLLSLIAEVEFERKNYIEVYKIMSRIFFYRKELNAKLGTICSYWLDSPWIERSEYV